MATESKLENNERWCEGCLATAFPKSTMTSCRECYRLVGPCCSSTSHGLCRDHEGEKAPT